eukprot:1152322-Pelagomonas_calceolata.AAC.1
MPQTTAHAMLHNTICDTMQGGYPRHTQESCAGSKGCCRRVQPLFVPATPVRHPHIVEKVLFYKAFVAAKILGVWTRLSKSSACDSRLNHCRMGTCTPFKLYSAAHQVRKVPLPCLQYGHLHSSGRSAVAEGWICTMKGSTGPCLHVPYGVQDKGGFKKF